jgi:ELWxxDGT repeat protein
MVCGTRLRATHPQTDMELWSTDGTSLGTGSFDINPGSEFSAPAEMAKFGRLMLFAALHLTKEWSRGSSILEGRPKGVWTKPQCSITEPLFGTRSLIFS